MANVKKFGALCGKFSDIADFVTVYISEGKLEYLRINTFLDRHCLESSSLLFSFRVFFLLRLFSFASFFPFVSFAFPNGFPNGFLNGFPNGFPNRFPNRWWSSVRIYLDFFILILIL